MIRRPPISTRTDTTLSLHDALPISVGRPAAIEQDVDAFLDLFLEAVVKVVVHLLDEFVVVKAVEIEIVVFRHRLSRSEEHTSELQSLMRISYAVFCLKKKKT